MNIEHLEILKSGVPAWNAWRAANPDVRPDLRNAYLGGADLGGAYLGGAYLGGDAPPLLRPRIEEFVMFFDADLLGPEVLDAALARESASLRTAEAVEKIAADCEIVAREKEGGR